jgi:hypothetical protein
MVNFKELEANNFNFFNHSPYVNGIYDFLLGCCEHRYTIPLNFVVISYNYTLYIIVIV